MERLAWPWIGKRRPTVWPARRLPKLKGTLPYCFFFLLARTFFFEAFFAFIFTNGFGGASM